MRKIRQGTEHSNHVWMLAHRVQQLTWIFVLGKSEANTNIQHSCLLWIGGLPLGHPDPLLFFFSYVSGESHQLPIPDYFFDRVMELVTVIRVVATRLMISAVSCLIRFHGFPKRFWWGDASLLEFLVEALSEDGLSWWTEGSVFHSYWLTLPWREFPLGAFSDSSFSSWMQLHLLWASLVVLTSDLW